MDHNAQAPTMTSARPIRLKWHLVAAITLTALAMVMPVQADSLDSIDQRLDLLERRAELQLDAVRALRKEIREARASTTSTEAQDQPEQATPDGLKDVDKYRALIHERLSRAWYPLASTRESDSTTVEMTLLPTGERAGLKLTKSNGSKAFDASVMGAAQAITRFPVPQDNDVFEQNFRTFTVEFAPGGLR